MGEVWEAAELSVMERRAVTSYVAEWNIIIFGATLLYGSSGHRLLGWVRTGSGAMVGYKGYYSSTALLGDPGS